MTRYEETVADMTPQERLLHRLNMNGGDTMNPLRRLVGEAHDEILRLNEEAREKDAYAERCTEALREISKMRGCIVRSFQEIRGGWNDACIIAFGQAADVADAVLNAADTPDTRGVYRIVVNSEPYAWMSPTISGDEVRKIVGCPPEHGVWVSGEDGRPPDMPMPAEGVKVAPNMRFYTGAKNTTQGSAVSVAGDSQT